MKKIKIFFAFVLVVLLMQFKNVYADSKVYVDKDTEGQNTYTTLTEAVQNVSNNGTIYLKDNIDATQTITIPENKNITITSENSAKTISKNYNGVLFYVSPSATLTLENVILDGKNVEATGDNFFVNVKGVLNIKDGAVLKNNTSKWNAGAIKLEAGTLNMTGGTITNNKTEYGGAIFATNGDSSTINISGGEITNNNATLYGGGAINITGGYTLNISGGSITNNHSENFGGGAIKVDNSKVFITGGKIKNNTATNGDGGAIWLYNTDCTIKNVEISGNEAKGKLPDASYNNVRGGAIFVHGASKLNIEENTIIDKNKAPYGGGIYALDSSIVNMNGGIIENNTASVNAGAICAFSNDGSPTININKGEIKNNINTGVDINPSFVSDQEFNGGAIYIGENANLNLSKAVIYNNRNEQAFLNNRNQDKGIYANGIGLCPNSKLYITNGGAIYNNNYNGGADILFIPVSTNIPFQEGEELYISNYSLGGGTYNWTNFANKNVIHGFQKITETEKLSYISHLSNADKNKAVKVADVIITNNVSKAVYGGGAIMCNGTLRMGTYGDLKITETVIGKEDDDLKYDFTITLDDATIDGRYGDMVFEKGVAEIELKNNESMTAKDLPSGIKYTVEEKNVPKYDTVLSKNDTGTLNDSITNVDFINLNVKPIKYGITVEKQIKNIDKTNDIFKFELKTEDQDGLIMPENNVLSIKGKKKATFDEITFYKPGIYTFTINEINEKLENYQYDSSSWKVIMNVELKDKSLVIESVKFVKDNKEYDKITFVNQYIKNPQTYDKTVLSIISLLILSIILVVIRLRYKKVKSY